MHVKVTFCQDQKGERKREKKEMKSNWKTSPFLYLTQYIYEDNFVELVSNNLWQNEIHTNILNPKIKIKRKHQMNERKK